MLNNSFNFENLIATGKVITTPSNTDLLTINVRDSRYGGGYQPVAIQFDDFAAAIGGGVSLTTVGTGGAATLAAGILNIPVYQDQLVSGSTIKTLEGQSLLGSGNIDLTKADVGLANADNTSDLNKPISTATQTALNAKQATLVSGTNIKTVNGTSLLGSGNIVAGAPAWLESNATDLTVWNNGKSNVTTNTSFGELALRNNVSGNSNTVVGYNALPSLTIGNNNHAFGEAALYSIVDGSSNIAVGNYTLYSGTNIGGNIAVGIYSLFNNISDFNVGVGYFAMYSNTTGYENTALGAFGLRANTTGILNTAVGNSAMYSNTTGFQNTAIGRQSMYTNTTGYGNTAVGMMASRENINGGYNVSVGLEAAYSNTSGGNNVAVGVFASRQNTISGYNVAVGYRSLYANQSDNNVAIGGSAASELTTASGIGQNTAVGGSALGLSTTGFRNVSVGFMAHRDGVNPRESVAIGFEALYNFTDFYSVAVGRGALRSNTTGASNVAVGANAATNITTGNSNVALGADALSATTTGNSNIAIGSAANGLNTTGTASIVIGLSAQAQDYSHSIVLGREATATASNQFVVGSTTYNAGTVTNAAAAQTHYWNVRINGTAYKILLST